MHKPHDPHNAQHSHDASMHRRFHGNVDRLRSPERLALLEVDRVVAHSLEGITAKTVLDVGVGTGVFAEAFAARGLQVTGVDINPDMIGHAQASVPAGHFQIAAAEALPFEDNTFDLVFASQVLHEADDAHRMLTEMRRVAHARVVLLEWPYRQEEMGPPLAMRIEPAAFVRLIEEAGFRHYEQVPLKHMTLYRLQH